MTRPATREKDGQATRHGCAAPGCHATIPHEYLMCNHHWQRVPKGIRDKVWRTWRHFVKCGQSGEGREDYLEARQEAIASVLHGQRTAK